MAVNKIIVAAVIAVVVVYASYFLRFYVSLDFELSNDSAVWGQLGDYIGGLLNPILSFITIVLLIRQLELQNESNLSLKEEMKSNDQRDRRKSFEGSFFNMINSQKELFDSFELEFSINGILVTKSNVSAVFEIEEEIERIRVRSKDPKLVFEYLENIDLNDQIFSVTRTFYVLVKMTMEKLSDGEGFDTSDRKSFLLTLVNFTDFAQLRLIMICIQFMKYHSTEYLSGCPELIQVLEEVGLDYSSY